MELHKKKLIPQIIIAILFGVFLNISTILLLGYGLFMRDQGPDGLEIYFKEFLMKPELMYSTIIQGNTRGSEIYTIMHTVYTDLKVHAVFWFIYVCFLYLGALKKKSLQRRDASDYGSHGSARWASDAEIKSTLQKDKSGFVIGKFKNKPAIHPLHSDLNNNIAVFGGSGTGKSAGFSITNILYNATNVGESMIITDPKGELYNTTVPTLREKGYDILYFNLLEPEKSMRYNPVDYVNGIEDAMSLAEMIIGNSGGSGGDPMWSNAEIAYFAALIMYLKETSTKSEQTMKSVLRLGTKIGKDEEVLDELFDSLPEGSEALEAYHIFRNAKDKTRAGILIGFGVRLKLWISNKITDLTAASDFDVNQLGRKKTALFLLIPDSDKTFNLLPSLLIDQAFQQLYRQAGKNDNLTLDVRVRCILDELANIARINDFELKVSTMRSRGIAVVPIFQTITQFRNRYDRDRWSEILGSTDTIVFLGTNDPETAKYFSTKLGNTTLLINSMSESDKHSSMSHNFVGRALLTPDELEKMSKHKLIMFQRGQNPARLDKYYYFKQKSWANLEITNWSKEIPIRETHKVLGDRSEVESNTEITFNGILEESYVVQESVTKESTQEEVTDTDVREYGVLDIDYLEDGPDEDEDYLIGLLNSEEEKSEII